MNSEYEALRWAYVTELREKKALVEGWWQRLNKRISGKATPS